MEIVFLVEHKPLGVPYMRQHDGKSHSYVDLRKQPAAIDLVPEAAKWPALRDTLVFLNDETRPFQSLGCAEFHYAEAAPPYLAAYVDFAFQDLSLAANPLNYYALFHRFTEFATTATAPDDLLIRIELRRTAYYAADVAGWCLEYWVRGLGNDTESRRAMPEAGFTFLREFLAAPATVPTS